MSHIDVLNKDSWICKCRRLQRGLITIVPESQHWPVKPESIDKRAVSRNWLMLDLNSVFGGKWGAFLSGENIPQGSLMHGTPRCSLQKHSQPRPQTIQGRQSGRLKSLQSLQKKLGKSLLTLKYRAKLSSVRQVICCTANSFSSISIGPFEV